MHRNLTTDPARELPDHASGRPGTVVEICLNDDLAQTLLVRAWNEGWSDRPLGRDETTEALETWEGATVLRFFVEDRPDNPRLTQTENQIARLALELIMDADPDGQVHVTDGEEELATDDLAEAVAHLGQTDHAMLSSRNHEHFVLLVWGQGSAGDVVGDYSTVLPGTDRLTSLVERLEEFEELERRG